MGRRPTIDTGTHLIARPKPLKSVSFVLVVADGPDKGRRFVLDSSSPSRLLTGKSASCQLCLTDPSVSRRHAAFDVVDRRLRLTDLGSSNGTFVNGIAIVEVFLDGGEFVRMGQTTFHVQQEEKGKEVTLSQRRTFGRVVGASEEMRRLYPLCERLAASDVPVLIEGETGCGKEVLAESLHEMGPRASGPFVVFDCMAAPPNLLESALFGHEKGSFTGATASRPGVFEQAHRGTLLIDEIGDLDISLQPKLLRAVQRMEVQRVGGNKPIKVDVRVMSATRRNLDEEVQAGRFRDDLFFRLNVARIELPPLRQRRGDVSLLARHFWDMLGGKGRPIPPALMDRLEAYSWPGNVRELYNTIARHLALGELAGELIGDGTRLSDVASSSASEGSAGEGDGYDFIDEVVARHLPLPEARQQVMEEFERRYIDSALSAHGGNVTKAAAASGVGRRYFHLLRARVNKQS
ncbi:MAG: sigma 54-interacting transcriptional regulator [Myxococcota bacterium]